jgi:hypothetical protein
MRELIAFVVAAAMPTAFFLLVWWTAPPRRRPMPMRTFTGLFFAGWFLFAEFVASFSFLGPRENQYLFPLADVIVTRWHVSSGGWPLLLNVAAYMGAGFVVGSALGAWFDAKARRDR